MGIPAYVRRGQPSSQQPNEESDYIRLWKKLTMCEWIVDTRGCFIRAVVRCAVRVFSCL